MKKAILITVFSILAIILMGTEITAQNFFTGEMGMSLNDYGRVRPYSDSLLTIQIDRSSILVATAVDAVFDYKKDAEAVDSSKTVTNPQISDFELFGSVDNSWDSLFAPPNVLCKINVYGWADENYVIVKFTVISREVNMIDAIIGMEAIAQIDGTYGLESIKYIDAQKVVSFFRLPTSTVTGYKILSAEMTTLNSIDWYDGYHTNDSDLYTWMTTGTIQPQFDSGGDGAVAFFSQNSVPISPGDSAVVYVGIAIGMDETEMLTNMGEAVVKYNLLTAVSDDEFTLPDEFKLMQNYPNPFNPSTTVSFHLPEKSNVSLTVHNSLGQEVEQLLNGEFSAGYHQVIFDAKDLPSGIYFYSLSTSEQIFTKKMILLK